MKRETLFKIFLPVVTFLICFAILELGAKFINQLSGLPREHIDFRRQAPAPYKHADYFSDAFIDESFTQPGGWHYDEKSGQLTPNDFAGRFYNVVNGLRVTNDQPATFSHRILLFGGSTMYNAEVPDTHTIASYLQRYVNQEHPGRYKVINHGVTTITILQQIRKLEALEINKGDIVVFYDGVNEIFQWLYYANKSNNLVERNRDAIRDMPWYQRALFHTHHKLSRNSELFKLLNPVDWSSPLHIRDDVLMSKLNVLMKKNYVQSIQKAATVTSSRGGVFTHFLQPHLFTDDKLSVYEQKLVKNYYIVQRGIEQAFASGYPQLKSAINQLPKDLHSYDISHVLDDRTNRGDFFFDVCHVNHEANSIIARAIYQHITRLM